MDLRQDPFPHVVIDDFLPDDLFVSVCEALEEIPLERKEADLFQFDQSAEISASPAFAGFHDALSLLQLSEVFGVRVSRLDMFAAFYYDTDYLLPHDDQLESRKIAYAYYVAAPDSGGELALIKDQAPYPQVLLEPVPNRLVLFLVDAHSWHEVREVIGDFPRISLSGWFH